MEIRRTQADQLAREQFEDRGAGGVNSSYTDADFLRMQLALLKSSVAKPTALRIRVDLLLGHFLVLRGETRRGAELADLAVRELPKEEGATPCWLLMLSISNGKTNKWGKRQYGAVIRNRDPLICSHSALAHTSSSGGTRVERLRPRLRVTPMKCKRACCR